MKKLSILMLAICSTAVFGQKVSDYKYVSIPEEFTTFKGDSYGLEAALAKALKGKNYVVLPASIDLWPSEAKDNSCNVLNANVLHVSSLLSNKLMLEFKDCNNKVILESKGSSNIKEFEEGLADALKVALIKVSTSSPVAMLPAKNQNQNQSATNISNPVQNAVREVPSKSSITPGAGNYSNGKVDVQKIEIDASQFILAKSGSSVPFAIFKTTSKKDVFIVKLSDNSITIGYFENGNIIIDIPQADGRYSKEVFAAK
ncbi:Uncharacterised protein [Chryseobacterium nakagawai]|uniref:Uncharacterized protein n=1 Tax=Chryseobacterium nakagawai TaxID=1241982 RepID=A0AAD0YTE0_CHRNA|nr:hypothetical protein [Chryseobacterium nakagawai]AZA93953.1 hypothetical protein EG343_17510 [Chryseobacterium nakagawai]VEH18835.1 Uncharacterised protein [Chryseobacterium nakagawai]